MKPASSKFHIVHKPDNWQQHDAPQYEQQLQSSANIAEERKLEKSAERFQPSQDLLNAINAALAARAPLLLTGEPGTGKTQVAWFLKRFFKIELFEYQVRSNSQSADLRYDFDAVAYLRDAYLAKDKDEKDGAEQGNTEPQQDPRSHPKYLKKGPLWNAYEHTSECLLLIDEIDKAPRDFPNDLLQEIDQHRFAHPFHQGEDVERQGAPPIIIITSNGERRLPDAFLRRCIVHHIEIDKILEDIMQAWKSQFPKLKDTAIRKQALKRFQEIRSLRLSKKPGAAELLLWLTVLSAQDIQAEDISDEVAKKDLPALLCLIKDHTDYKLLE
ncbi:MAG: MoxR family ATPase [Thiotrichaceae bacterium]